MTEAGYLLELMDRSPVLCFVKDREGKYLYVNRAWLELAGRSREEVLGHTDHEVFNRASADEFVENDRQPSFQGAPDSGIRRVFWHFRGFRFLPYLHWQNSVELPTRLVLGRGISLVEALVVG